MSSSLRRRSCNACFKGRRKCDRGYPTCGTCRRTKKSCHYVYAPISSTSLPGDPVSAGTDTVNVPPAHADSSSLGLVGDESDFLAGQGWPARCSAWMAAPIAGGGSLASSGGAPWDLATRGETLFLHKNLYRDTMPRAIRAALGTSAAFCMLDEDRRHLLFRALDAEVLELIRTPPPMDADEDRVHGFMGSISTGSSGLTLIEELARLQAFTLYQMMRMYGGGLEQRIVVQQQRGLLMTWALQLLRRSRAELGGDEDRASGAGGYTDCWHTWILAESIRRTVMVVYMFYGMYSLATEGFCSELPTLAKLPVSAAPALWNSEAAYLAHSRSGEAPKTLTGLCEDNDIAPSNDRVTSTTVTPRPKFQWQATFCCSSVQRFPATQAFGGQKDSATFPHQGVYYRQKSDTSSSYAGVQCAGDAMYPARQAQDTRELQPHRASSLIGPRRYPAGELSSTFPNPTINQKANPRKQKKHPKVVAQQINSAPAKSPSPEDGTGTARLLPINARTPKRQNAKTPKRQNARTPERQNARTPERQNAKTPKRQTPERQNAKIKNQRQEVVAQQMNSAPAKPPSSEDGTGTARLLPPKRLSGTQLDNRW
ncbi:c6 zinc finger domain-containing protein [Diaporthe eres]|nr:c6 zinc finger domain-containing protein [Diaporthe eres]